MRSFYDREIKRVDYVNKRKEIRQIEMREKKKAGGGDGDAAAKVFKKYCLMSFNAHSYCSHGISS